jgi:hypothetical protein
MGISTAGMYLSRTQISSDSDTRSTRMDMWFSTDGGEAVRSIRRSLWGLGGQICMGVAKVTIPWDFRQPSKWRSLAIFKGTDRVQSYQLAMRTELIHSVGLYLSLHNM